MKELEQLFFEMIRVSIGTQVCLSRLLSHSTGSGLTPAEWETLFDMAVKQSLVGICFCGLHRLGADSDNGFTKIGMSEDLFFKWMGMAVQINMRNDVINKQCVALQKRLSASGFRSSILKGQGVADLYKLNENSNENCRQDSSLNPKPSTLNLGSFRQSGDIDIYVDCDLEKAVAYAKKVQEDVKWDYKHLHLNVFNDTEVEMHYRPEYLANLWHNRKLQKWVLANQEHAFGRKAKVGDSEITTPDMVFNSLYVLIHIYNHNFRAGVGLRQLMDYYFVISERVMTDEEKQNLCAMLSELGMKKYASGIMWIMREVFGMKEEYMICRANENEGRYILDGVMIGGNMGHGYMHSDKKLSPVLSFIKSALSYSCRSFGRYPIEALSYPMWTIYHFVWKRIKRMGMN